MTAVIRGDYSYHTIPASVVKTVQRYIPSLLTIQNLCEYNQEKSIQYSRQSDEKGDGQTQKRQNPQQILSFLYEIILYQ